MKKIALPLLFALSFLMLSHGIGSAQIPLTPDYVEFTFDSSSATYNLNQSNTPQYKILGSIKSLMAYNLKVTIHSANQWVISTKINGAIVQNGDMVSMGQNQTFPVEFDILPYAEKPDTENYCIILDGGQFAQAGQCLTLTVTDTKSAVSDALPTPNISISPNPAGSYISVSGLNDMVSGYRYEIFSISGAEVLHGLMPANARINVQDLSSSAYRLILSDAKGIVSNSAITVLH